MKRKLFSQKDGTTFREDIKDIPEDVKNHGVTLTKHTLEEILDAVSEYTSQSKESIRSKPRKPCYVWARAIFIVIAKKNYHSDKYIASFLNKDRTCIVTGKQIGRAHV